MNPAHPGEAATPRSEKVIGSGFYRNAAPGTFGQAEWLDLLMACQDGRATCMRVLEIMDREHDLLATKTCDELAEMFLRWPLPDTVCADLCATDTKYKNRVGTNLLTVVEARQMMRDLVGPVVGKLESELATLRAKLAEAEKDAERLAGALEVVRDTAIAVKDSLRSLPPSGGSVLIYETPERLRALACDALAAYRSAHPKNQPGSAAQSEPKR